MSDHIAVQNQILGVDDRNNWNDLQSNFCSVLIVSVTSRIHLFSLLILLTIGRHQNIREGYSAIGRPYHDRSPSTHSSRWQDLHCP